MKKRAAKSKEAKEKLLLNPDIVFRSEGKEALLFDPDTGSIRILNHLGKLIWKLINGRNTPKDIKAKLTKKFPDVSPAAIGKDMDKFLTELKEHGYIGKKM